MKVFAVKKNVRKLQNENYSRYYREKNNNYEGKIQQNKNKTKT